RDLRSLPIPGTWRQPTNIWREATSPARRPKLPRTRKLEPHLEHEDVVVVVFDVKHFGRDAASIPLLTAGFVSISRRMRGDQLEHADVYKCAIHLEAKSAAVHPLALRDRSGTDSSGADGIVMVLLACRVIDAI